MPIGVTGRGRWLLTALEDGRFTDISMYPKALAAGGLAHADLITALIDHAIERHRRMGW